MSYSNDILDELRKTTSIVPSNTKKKKSSNDILDELRELAEADNEKRRKEQQKETLKSTVGTLGGDDDIAPVSTGKGIFDEGTKWYQGWVDKGAMEDGFSVKNLAKTVLGTMNDNRETVTKAVIDATENLVDAGAIATGTVGRIFSKDFQQKAYDFAEKDLFKSQETSEKIMHGLNWIDPIGVATNLLVDDTEDASVMGDKSDGMLESMAHMVGSAALGRLGVPTWLTQGINAFSPAFEEAKAEGATDTQAAVNAGVAAVAEVLIEKLSGGIVSGTGADDLFLKPIVNKISNKFVAGLVKFGGKTALEGAEEVATEFATDVAKRLTYDKDVFKDEDTFDRYVTTFLSGAIMGAAGQGAEVGQARSQGRNYATGMTDAEFSVVDKLINDEVSKREANGKKVSQYQKNKIEAEIIEKMEKGTIKVDEIESILGGESYKTYDTEWNKLKSTDDWKELNKVSADEKVLPALQKEYDELHKMKRGDMTGEQIDKEASLKSRIEAVQANKSAELFAKLAPEANRITQLRNKMRGEVITKVGESRLAESYRELERSKQKFTAYTTKYTNENAKKTVQNIIDSDLGDNSNAFHAKVELLAKVSADTGVTYTLTEDSRLAGTEHYQDGMTTHGFIDDNGNIVINMDSKRLLATTAGHEVGHKFQKAGLDKKYSDILRDYCVTKEGLAAYNKRIEDAKIAYKDKTNTTAEIEVANDLLGEYIFNDENFIKHLSTADRNVFQKVYDTIKYMCKIATAGSEEKRLLEKAKHEFEKAWREISKTKDANAETTADTESETVATDAKYSLSANARTELHTALYDTRYRNDVQLRDVTPPIMLAQKGVKNLPMAMTASHIRENVFSEDEARTLGLPINDNTHYHGLGEDFFLNVIDGLDNVKLAYRGTKNAKDPTRRENYFLLISEFKHEGNTINVPVYIDKKAQVNRVFIDANKISTVFGRNNFDEYIKTQIKRGELVRIKNRDIKASESGTLIVPGYSDDVSIETKVAQESEKVKNNLSDENIQDISTGYAYGETYFTMSYTQDGKEVGKLEYGVYEDVPNVKMVEVDPEYRRKGIATKLLQTLQKKYPDAEINFGMRTPDGAKLLDAITYDVTDDAVVADKQLLSDLQAELDNLQARLDVLFDTDNLTEAQEAEMQELGDQWQEVYETIHELEPKLRGKKSTHTYVNYSMSKDDGDIVNEGDTAQETEILYSLSKDSEFSDKAISKNEEKLLVDAEAMFAAKELRNRIATRMNDIKDRGLVALPDDVEGNTYIANSSYDGTEENTTICPRSLASEAFVDAVSEYLGRPLTVEEQIYISQDLQGRSMTPECTYCYVATDRKAYRAFLGEYINQRTAVIDKLKSDPNADTSRSGELYKDFLNGRKDTNPMYNRFKMWVDTYKSGKPMVDASHLANINKLMGDINSEFGAELKPQIVDAMKYAQSASWAKKRVNYVAYNGHILNWKQDRINKLNSHYGLRMYSFSDFHPAFVLENMQMITDASVRGLKMLGYTKDIDFVEIFAPSGMNINVSTFGFETDGNVYENNIIGAEWEKAKALREQYPNVGITFVATNDTLVNWALDQDWIDVVIPYHLVRTGAEVAKAFGYTNYTSESSDTKTKEWAKGDKKYIAPTEHNNDKATYLSALEKNHLQPRFERFIDNPNYMKLVNECRQPASESKPVQPVFNEEAAMVALAKLEANGYYQPIGGSVDRMYEIAAQVAEDMENNIAPTKYSMSKADDQYMEAVNIDDMISAEKAVEEYANLAMPDSKIRDADGKLLPVYHGTDAMFYEFDPSIGGGKNGTAEGFGIYLSDNQAVTKSYGDRQIKMFANITKPATSFDKTISRATLVKLIKQTCQQEAQRMVDEDGYGNVREAIRDTWISNYVDTYSTNIEQAYREVAQSILEQNDNDKDIVHEVMFGMAIRDYDAAMKFYRESLTPVTGIDGFITEWDNPNTGETSTIYLAFDSSQLKSADAVTRDDNGNVIPLSERFDPTKKDIRFSVSKDNNDYSPYREAPADFGYHDPLDDFAPVRDDIDSERREAFDALTDADVPPVWGVTPDKEITTVEDRVNAKIQNTQTELDNNRAYREQSFKEYDEEIARLQEEYDSKKNKNTMAANNLLRRIERAKRMRGNIDADYAKRISDLEKRLEKYQSPEYKRSEQRRAKYDEYKTMWEEMLGDTSTWKDKALGLSYKTTTMRRFLRDVVRDETGKKDFAKADAIYDELETKYDHHEAQLKRESGKLKESFFNLKLNKHEDTYAHMVGEFRHNPETTLTQEMVDDYYNKHKNHINKAKVDHAIEEARNTFDSLIVRVNEVLKEQGMKEIPYRKGYFPHFKNPKQGFLGKLLNWKKVDTEIPTSIAGLTENFNPERSWQSFNKQRKGDSTDYSLYQGLDTYIHGALDWIYHIEDIQKRRALENYIRYIHSEEGIQARIDEIRANETYDADEAQKQIELVLDEASNPLNNLVTELRARTNTLANKKSSMDRGMEEATNRKIYSTMTNINNRVNANMVVGSLSSALTNFIPMVQSWHQVSPLYTVRGLGDFVRSAVKDDGMIAKSDFLTNRLVEEEKLYKTGWDKVSDKAAMMMNVIDNITSQTVWRSKYLQNKHEGMSEAQAIKDADQFAKNLIAGRSRGNMPTIFESKNPLIKICTAFQLEVANQYGFMFKDTPQDSKNAVRLVKGYAAAFMGAYLYNALYSSITGRDAAFDPIGIIEDLLRDLGFGDDEEKKETKEVILNFADNVVDEMPFISGLTGGGRVPLSSAMPYDGIGAAFEGIVTDVSEEDYKSIAKEMLNPLYYLIMPVGGGQVKKTVEGLSMFSDDHPVAGSYTDSGALRFPVEDTFGNKVKAALFGQWSSKNARDYIEQGRKPLSEKQLQEYIDLEMPIQDYWEYHDGLKKQETLEDKFDYIAGLDISVEQKNIMINNIVDRKDQVDMTNYDEIGDYEEFDFYSKNTEKYEFLQKYGVSYQEYTSSEEAKENYDSIYSWTKNYPNKVTVSEVITDNVIEYRGYTSALDNIRADKDENGKSISGSAKEKKKNYIFNLDLEDGQKYILFKSEYPADDTYNYEIIDYLNNRDDVSYSEMITILKELGFTIGADGVTITWD